MKVVKRTKDGIDILEHAMQGVHTSENRGRIVRFHAERGIIGKSSTVEVRAANERRDDDEVEVIVRIPTYRHPRR